MIATEYYLALDLELNNAEDGSTTNPPIIQVGVAIGTFDHYTDNAIITKKWYLNPNEPIYPFITNLTGITDEDILTKSVTHEVLAEELATLIRKYKPFINPVTWGGGDSIELKQEFIDRNIAFPFFGRRWIDVKTWYVLRMIAAAKRPAGGLRSAMGLYKMNFDGTPHRADDDALNTLRLFFKIVNLQTKTQYIINLAKEC
ncbi:hypothetical protein [Lake Baikal phage Baikal-20-5m-C28]|nr:hypothetical protein [Lake Baikal phage Baikal-20-5m-C28]